MWDYTVTLENEIVSYGLLAPHSKTTPAVTGDAERQLPCPPGGAASLAAGPERGTSTEYAAGPGHTSVVPAPHVSPSSAERRTVMLTLLPTVAGLEKRSAPGDTCSSPAEQTGSMRAGTGAGVVHDSPPSSLRDCNRQWHGRGGSTCRGEGGRVHRVPTVCSMLKAASAASITSPGS